MYSFGVLFAFFLYDPLLSIVCLVEFGNFTVFSCPMCITLDFDGLKSMRQSIDHFTNLFRSSEVVQHPDRCL